MCTDAVSRIFPSALLQRVSLCSVWYFIFGFIFFCIELGQAYAFQDVCVINHACGQDGWILTS